ncbi:type VI secretion protein [Altererythrobacter luteolus]|uniref:Type VI secretion protein n=1 Tax=Pontixanthobacter luteolus TaxID=295089 RepID=A0A6I4UZH2_9SPHN|nr:type IV secretion system protein [Pontixanthobacter luteolus]MXP45950.1 type VI secretion protein [Pontixanthobacter luteolus]
MSTQCDALMEDVGSGVAAALRAVDCTASEVSAAAFGRLFAPGGAMGSVLTILLALFIAFFAIALLLGRSNLSVRSLVPRMITLGLVMTFATSWFAYQTVVWNLTVAAPDYIASVLTGNDGSATTTFADKLDIVFLAVQQATEAAGGQGAQGAGEITAFSPQGILWLGALLFLLGTVGVLVTSRIALAILVALGPIFVVMALFNGTRGLFTGWLKGLVMLALTPLFAVLGGGVMLELAVPILSSLTQVPGQIDPRSAMAFFLIGAVHAALMIMVLKVSATMVSGWKVFGLVPGSETANAAVDTAHSTPPASTGNAPMSTAQAAGMSNPPRRISVSGVTPSPAANDASGLASAATNRTTKVFATSSGSGQIQPLSSGTSRTRGIGNRFRPAKNRTSEKLK